MSDWISVNERLPSMYQDVLVYMPSYEYSNIAIDRVVELKGAKMFSRHYIVSYVTHWMPLPEPPEGGEHE